MDSNNYNQLSKKRLRLFKLLLVGGGLILGLFLAELSLRVANYSFPDFYSPDDKTGYSLTPKMKGWYRKEGVNYVEINSDGLRDEEHSISKPAGSVRIAIVGDSYCEALQVPIEDAFWKVMQKELQRQKAFEGKPIEVINFGVSGYSTAQEFLTLKEKVWKYSPDVVILAVTTNNDVTDNSRHFKKIEIPYFVYRDDELSLDDSFRDSASFKFKKSTLSRLGQWFKNNLRIVQAAGEIQIALKYKIEEWKNRAKTPAQAGAENLAGKENALPKPAEIGIDNQIYHAPKDQQWSDAWRVTEGLIALMNEEVKLNGASLLVVTLSNPPQVHPSADMREDFIKKSGAENLFYPDDRVRSFCESHKIPVVTLAPDLLSYAESHKVYLHGFGKEIGNGHWNVLGHRVAGEILSAKLSGGILK